MFLLALRLCAQHIAWYTVLLNDSTSRAQFAPLDRWGGEVIEIQASGYTSSLCFFVTRGLGLSLSLSQLPHQKMEFIKKLS